MRDEENGEPEALLQGAYEVEDLRLHRYVERRYRLVGDERLRLQRERTRNPDPLPLPARELVRIARRSTGRKPDEGEKFSRLLDGKGRISALRDRPFRNDPLNRPAPDSTRHKAWKTIWIRRRGEGPPCERPLKGFRRPRSVSRRVRRGAARSAATVDFPEPNSPTRPSVSPRLMSKVISSGARTRDGRRNKAGIRGRSSTGL